MKAMIIIFLVAMGMNQYNGMGSTQQASKYLSVDLKEWPAKLVTNNML